MKLLETLLEEEKEEKEKVTILKTGRNKIDGAKFTKIVKDGKTTFKITWINKSNERSEFEWKKKSEADRFWKAVFQN